MKKTAFITAAAACIILATSCGLNTSKQPTAASVQDNFLIVPGERAGLFVLNQKYLPVETLYQGLGFTEKTDKWGINATIQRNAEDIIEFRLMMDADSEPIPRSVGDWINISSADFRTAENTGVGSSLQDLIDVYQDYRLSLEYEEEKYVSADQMLKDDLPDGISVRLACRDPDEEETGIAFFLTLNISNDRAKIKNESKVYMVQIYVRDMYSRKAISLQALTPDELPGEIGYQGDFVEAYRYTDATGENIVLTAETEVTVWEEGDDDTPATSNKAVYAYRFLKNGNDWEEVWRVYDMEFECINDPVAQIVRGALSITDLNGDGVAEIWMIYLKSCHGDVSPDNMFLRMYDNDEVYTITGTTKLTTPFGVMGGEYTLDNNFLEKNTPSAYVEYAKALWEKHQTTTNP